MAQRNFLQALLATPLTQRGERKFVDSLMAPLEEEIQRVFEITPDIKAVAHVDTKPKTGKKEDGATFAHYLEVRIAGATTQDLEKLAEALPKDFGPEVKKGAVVISFISPVSYAERANTDRANSITAIYRNSSGALRKALIGILGNIADHSPQTLSNVGDIRSLVAGAAPFDSAQKPARRAR